MITLLIILEWLTEKSEKKLMRYYIREYKKIWEEE